MKWKKTAIGWVWLMVIGVFFVCGAARGADQGGEVPMRFQLVEPYLVEDPSMRIRMEALAEAVDFEKWPRTEVRRLAPTIDKSLLGHPELVTREWTSYGHVVPGPGAGGWWKWRRKVENPEPLPTEIPADLVRSVPRPFRDDPEKVKWWNEKELEAYRRTKKYLISGWIQLKVAVTPSCRAAQEWLLYNGIVNSLPIEAAIYTYSRADRPDDLGTVSFVRRRSGGRASTSVHFVRDNICVLIRAKGDFVDEALPLARKIDALILQQPELTYEQLMALKPTVAIAESAVKPDPSGMLGVSFDASAPAGQEIVHHSARVDHQGCAIREGKIQIGPVKPEVTRIKVKLTVITKGLLSATTERDVNINR